MAVVAAMGSVVREFTQPLVLLANIADAQSELVKRADGSFAIETRAEHRLYAFKRSTLHAQTLEALNAGEIDVARWLEENIVSPHFRTFGDELREAALAASIAWTEKLETEHRVV